MIHPFTRQGANIKPRWSWMIVDEWSKPCLGATASGTQAITRHITAHTVTQLAEPMNTAGARRNTSSRPISASAGPSSFPPPSSSPAFPPSASALGSRLHAAVRRPCRITRPPPKT